MPSRPRLRPALLFLHRWLGVLLLVLLVPVAVSGALLVWKDGLDSLINPHRYAVSGQQTTLAPSAYLASAGAVLESGILPVAVRYPDSPDWPVIVNARGAASPGQPLQVFTIYLDPATGKVLDKIDFRRSLFGFLHVFHENLTIPQNSGRAIVGWAGVAMAILSITGLWMWWPRNGAWRRALRFRRTADHWNNLHQILGFWISLPLAIVSITGIYLSFPPQARDLMAAIAPTSPRINLGGPVVRQSDLSPDRALEIAVAAEPGAQPAALFLPVAARGQDGATWRVQLRRDGNDPVTLLVNDRGGTVSRPPPPLAGDRAAQWIRWIHDGGRGGIVWESIVFLTGVFPAIFAVTGVVMWLRGRRRRKTLARRQSEPALQPTEQPAE